MITTAPNENAFRTAPSFGVPAQRVDRQKNIIFGASIIQAGDVNDDRPWTVDNETLQSVADFGNRPNKGIKARVTHPNMSNDGFGSHLGRWKNFRVDGDSVRADLHIADSAFDTPKGDLASYVLDLAEEDPEAFGVSIATKLDHEGMEATENEGRSMLRISGLRAADIVDEPAATRGGFFSAENFEASDIPSAVTWLLDNHFKNAGREVVTARFESLLDKYFGAKPMTTENVEQQVENPDLSVESPETPEAPVVEETPAEVPAVEEKPETEEGPENLGAKFLEAFGTQGGVWFAEGKSFEEARDLHFAAIAESNEALAAENADLKKRLNDADLGVEELSGGVPQKPEDNSERATKEKHFRKSLPGPEAAMAASIFANNNIQN